MNYAGIQHKIDRGLGLAARKLGQPYQVYRVTGTCFGDFPLGWTKLWPNPLRAGWLPIQVGVVGPAMLLYKEEISEAKIEWGFKGSSVKFYKMFGEIEPLLLGDILLQVDPSYVPGVSYGSGATLLTNTQAIQGMGFAWHMPVNIPIGAWINRTATIWRPALVPQPQSDGSYYWNETHDNDWPLVLNGGNFNFYSGLLENPSGGFVANPSGGFVQVPPGEQSGILTNPLGGTVDVPGGGVVAYPAGVGVPAASLIPIGISASERSERGQNFPPAPPGVTVPVRYYAYIPPLPGYTPREGDNIILSDDERYVVVHPFRQESGVVGSNLVLHRTAAPP